MDLDLKITILVNGETLKLTAYYLQDVARKLSRSMSKEVAAETAAAMVEAERERR